MRVKDCPSNSFPICSSSKTEGLRATLAVLYYLKAKDETCMDLSKYKTVKKGAAKKVAEIFKSTRKKQPSDLDFS